VKRSSLQKKAIKFTPSPLYRIGSTGFKLQKISLRRQ
jgi:hypothetical protein